ncbi:hypothetical protein L6164_003498 [Bauhinia variegata]|uniref:Uncharacterized protein n=1 Tax=Bauhinia variegata TaxID=167791 RepID=A0ACB9Q1H6_BAUVA|nr:hypothetical protein L6164_003498 [Bauhinia variegata]
MDNPKQSVGSFAILFLFFAGLVFLYNWSSYASPLVSIQKSICNSENPTTIGVSEDELGSILAKASTRNKTVIITIVNKAYTDQDINEDSTMLDLFLNSFWLGEGTRSLLDNLLIVAVDQTAYDRCRFLRLNCFRLESDGVDFEREKVYMSQEFITMMWRRTNFLLEVLKRGYNFIFTDTDVMWLRNPFEKLSSNETEDIQISTDKYLHNPWSEKNPINTGFYFVRSNNKTISLFETWYGKKNSTAGQKEQDVLQDLIRDGIFGQLGLKVRFLDTLYFSGFCQDSRDFGAVTTVHANCCRHITAKVADLKVVLGDWKQYRKFESDKRLNANLTMNIQWSGHFGCWNSWKRLTDTQKAEREPFEQNKSIKKKKTVAYTEPVRIPANITNLLFYPASVHSCLMDPSLLFNQLKGADPFFLLAGPNVIESEEHILRMAKHIKSISSKFGLPLVFKSSFDKANRTSSKSFRGPGMTEGLKILEKVKIAYDIPVVTDVHETIQCEPVGRVADIIQIPAFLCRQTDLLVAAAKTGKIVNIKKGQFCAPSVMANSAEKVRLAGNPNVMVCERGTMFGYNDLIVDPRNLEWLREANCPVVADVTHALQQPAGKKLDGGGVASGGLRELIPCIARTAVAVGVDGIFMEVHDDPLNAPVDGPTQWPLRHLEELLEELVAISRVSKGKQRFNIDLTPFRE